MPGKKLILRSKHKNSLKLNRKKKSMKKSMKKSIKKSLTKSFKKSLKHLNKKIRKSLTHLKRKLKRSSKKGKSNALKSHKKHTLKSVTKHLRMQFGANPPTLNEKIVLASARDNGFNEAQLEEIQNHLDLEEPLMIPTALFPPAYRNILKEIRDRETLRKVKALILTLPNVFPSLLAANLFKIGKVNYLVTVATFPLDYRQMLLSIKTRVAKLYALDILNKSYNRRLRSYKLFPIDVAKELMSKFGDESIDIASGLYMTDSLQDYINSLARADSMRSVSRRSGARAGSVGSGARAGSVGSGARAGSMGSGARAGSMGSGATHSSPGSFTERSTIYGS